MYQVHAVKEVWRGTRGVFTSCHLECSCGWISVEASDPAQLRVPRALHLDEQWGATGAGPGETHETVVSGPARALVA